VQLRTARQRRRDAPVPQHVEEEPQEIEEENMVDETGVGVADIEPVTEFQQLSQVMWTWIEFTIEREKRRDRDVPSSSHTVQLTSSTFTGMDN